MLCKQQCEEQRPPIRHFAVRRFVVFAHVTQRVEADAAADQAVDRAFSRAAWHAVGCRDVARVDFMLDHRGPWFLEINTMPGFTDHSLVPKAARHAGKSMEDLVSGLVARALSRARTRRAAA